jgi:hypothetical protein
MCFPDVKKLSLFALGCPAVMKSEKYQFCLEATTNKEGKSRKKKRSTWYK